MQQYFFDVLALAPRRARRQVEFRGGQNGVGYEVIVLRLDDVRRFLALVESDGEGFAQPLDASSATCVKGVPPLLLISWTTPSNSPLWASVIGATSISLVR